MRYDLVPIQPDPRPPMSIVVGGVTVGDLDDNEGRVGADRRYHAALRPVAVGLSGSSLALIQGHGATADEAIRDAFAAHARDAQILAAAVAKLAADMGAAP